MLDLLFKYFRDEASDSEKKKIGDWLDADPIENAKMYKDARFIFEASVIHEDNRVGFAGRILRIAGISVAGIAAMIAVLVGGGYLGQQHTLNTLTEKMMTVEIPAGQRLRITLPDGSEVWLNAETRMEYPLVFSKHERRVKLSGEALFDVVHNPSCPFIVETFMSEVEVLGTRFNVTAIAPMSEFSTILLEGSVKVSSLTNNDVITMKPNEVVNYVDGRLRLEELKDKVSLCWVDGQVSIAGVSFDALMDKFEKAFGVKIIINRKNSPSMDYARGKIRISDGIDHALHVLQHSIDFKYTKDDETNTITIIE